MTHLSQMSITNFSDQKAIISAVKEALFKSSGPARGSLDEIVSGGGAGAAGGEQAQPKKRTQRRSQGRKSFEKRPSFDFKKQFDKIDAMRGELDVETKKKKVEGIRRKSFDPDDKTEMKSDLMMTVEKNIAEDDHAEARIMAGTKQRKKMGENTDTKFRFTDASTGADEKAARKARAQQYGNSAQRTAKADDGLHKLGLKVMKKFKDDIKCERASIMFFDSLKNDLFFYSEEKRFRFDMSQGVAGYCARTGEIVNVPDAYDDSRFLPDLDKQTGFKTRNILAAPIRARGAEGIIAVIQMLNKNLKEDNGVFTEFDEQLITDCSFRVSEALSLQFETLVNAQVDMERMSLDGMKAAKVKANKELEGGGDELAWDEVPLKESQGRVVTLNKETDAFAEVRRKRVSEYGKEVRESKIGM